MTFTYHLAKTRSFHITVFDSVTSNCAFYFYESYSPDKLEAKLDMTLAVIKKGGFSEIQKASREQDL